jgi:hypothetical protein
MMLQRPTRSDRIKFAQERVALAREELAKLGPFSPGFADAINELSEAARDAAEQEKS